jgi:predicted CXXCH cytochrome family protein
MPSSHSELQALRCRDCHPPHAPMLAALPVQFVPQQARAVWISAYDWETSNSGCMACHPAGQLMYGLAQGFVTLNTENYHARHVQSGRVLCLECHAEHGSFLPKLLRSRLLTGEVLSYTQRNNGGTCDIQCHGIYHDTWSYMNAVY